MIDWIEELLSKMAADDEEEERQEDALALTMAEEAVPASPRKNRGEAGDGEMKDDSSGGRTVEEIASERPGLIAGESGNEETGDRSGQRAAGEILLERPGPIVGAAGSGETGDRSGGRTAGEILLERPGSIAGAAGSGKKGDSSGGRTAGEILLERSGRIAGETAVERIDTAGELWKDGPVWTVRRGPLEIDEARKAAAAKRTDRAEKDGLLQPLRDGELIWTGLERAARGITAGFTPEGAERSGTARAGLEQAGLEGLYRQTVQGLRPAAPALPPEQTGKTVRVQEPGSAASLAVDELDRAVRRDSRRYDGGMSIY